MVSKEMWSNFIRKQLTENTLRGDLFTVLLKVHDCAALLSKQQRIECFTTTLYTRVVPSRVSMCFWKLVSSCFFSNNLYKCYSQVL